MKNKMQPYITQLEWENASLRQMLRDLAETIDNEEQNGILDQIKENENLINILKQAGE
jgi:hypothetical protein